MRVVLVEYFFLFPTYGHGAALRGIDSHPPLVFPVLKAVHECLSGTAL